MNILQWLVGFELPKKAQESQTQLTEEQIEDEAVAQITFTLFANGNAHFGCHWMHNTKFVANGIAELLFHINNGGLKAHIVSTLKQQAGDVENSKFINKVFKTWHKLEHLYNDKPVVSPIEVFNINKVNSTDDEEEEES